MFSFSLPWAYLYLLYYIFWTAYIRLGVFIINLFLNSIASHAILLALISWGQKWVYMHLRIIPVNETNHNHTSLRGSHSCFKRCLRSMSRWFILLSQNTITKGSSKFIAYLFMSFSIGKSISTKLISQLILDLQKLKTEICSSCHQPHLALIHLFLSCTFG